MRSLVLFAVLTSVVQVQAQTVEPTPRPPLEQMLKMRIVYSVPGMDRVEVRKDVVYKSVQIEGGKLDLKADVYIPAGAKPDDRFPTVLLINGGSESGIDWRITGVYQSYGQLLAASGFVGVPFLKRFKMTPEGLEQGETDVEDLIRYLQEHASEFHIAPDRFALWAFSAGGALLGFPFREAPPNIRAVVAFYAVLELAVHERFSPLAQLKGRTAAVPPLLIARAGLDSPQLNSGIDKFVQQALAGNRTVEVLNHPTGRHGFDILDDNDRSREIIRRAVEFVRAHTGLSASPQTGGDSR